MHTAFLTAILASAPLTALVGQQDGHLLQPGAAIRVSHNYVCSKRSAGENSCTVVTGVAPIVVTGTLRSLNADSLALTLGEAETLTLPRTSVTKLEVSRGRKSHTGKGIAYGALAGLATGGITGAILCKSDYACSNSNQEEGDMTPAFALAGAILGAVAGTVVGGILGATHSTERWEQVAF